MDNIEELLRALTEEDGSEKEQEKDTSDRESSEGGGLFGDLDPSILLTAMSLFESMNKQDDSERLLLALKPLLREENRAKIDTAVKFMKLFSLLPLIKDSGMLGKLL